MKRHHSTGTKKSKDTATTGRRYGSSRRQLERQANKSTTDQGSPCITTSTPSKKVDRNKREHKLSPSVEIDASWQDAMTILSPSPPRKQFKCPSREATSSPPRKQTASAATSPPPQPPPAVPDELLCPITLSLMSDPVLAMDGHTYERAAIEDWLRRSRDSPRTGVALASDLLVPNHPVMGSRDPRGGAGSTAPSQAHTAPSQARCPLDSQQPGPIQPENLGRPGRCQSGRAPTREAEGWTRKGPGCVAAGPLACRSVGPKRPYAPARASRSDGAALGRQQEARRRSEAPARKRRRCARALPRPRG